MNIVIIGTWRMVLDGIAKANKSLIMNASAIDAIEEAIIDVEDNEKFISVGYGALPNILGKVQLDAAIMDGTTYDIGAIGAIENYKNPISIAKSLLKNEYNNFLVGKGAENYAKAAGFKKTNLLTKQAKKRYKDKKLDLSKGLEVYKGHDTVGVVALDRNNNIAAATSTSGLFMKHEGRLGDSALIGNGFYADSKIGGATATGVGEDIMRGVLSYEIVRKIKDGISPMDACKFAVDELVSSMEKMNKEARDISVIAIDKLGRWGAYTNQKHFSFVVAEGGGDPIVYIASNVDGSFSIKEASKKWILENIE